MSISATPLWLPELTLVVVVVVLVAVGLRRGAAGRGRRVRSATAAESALGLPVLAHLESPRDPAGDHGGLPALALGSPAAEPFGWLRRSLEAVGEEPSRILVVTGTGRNDLNAWVAANLAVTWAQEGRSTLLLDMRVDTGPSVSAPDSPGLMGVLTGVPLTEAVTPGPRDGLVVLPAGAAVTGPLLSAGLGAVAEQVAAEFDMAVAIATSHSPEADGVDGFDAVDLIDVASTLLVVEAGSITPHQLAAIGRRTAATGAVLVDVVAGSH